MDTLAGTPDFILELANMSGNVQLSSCRENDFCRPSNMVDYL